MKREQIERIMIESWKDIERYLDDEELPEDKKELAEAIKSNMGLMSKDKSFDFLDVLFLIARIRYKDTEIAMMHKLLDLLQVPENTLMYHYIMLFYHQDCIENMSMDMLFHIFE